MESSGYKHLNEQERERLAVGFGRGGKSSIYRLRPAASCVYVRAGVRAQSASRWLRGLCSGRFGAGRADGEAPSPRGGIHQLTHERPMEVEGRVIPGNWESDLLIGKAKSPAAVGVIG